MKFLIFHFDNKILKIPEISMDEVSQKKKCQAILHYLQHQALGQAVNCHVKQISRTFSIASICMYDGCMYVCVSLDEHTKVKSCVCRCTLKSKRYFSRDWTIFSPRTTQQQTKV